MVPEMFPEHSGWETATCACAWSIYACPFEIASLIYYYIPSRYCCLIFHLYIYIYIGQT